MAAEFCRHFINCIILSTTLLEMVHATTRSEGFSKTIFTAKGCYLNPTALRKTNIAHNFGLSECHRVKLTLSALNLYKAIICEKKKKNAMVKSANPDEMTFNEPSHPDLHHLKSLF